MTRGTLIDAHVHLYDCHDPGDMLDAAAANFAAGAASLGWAKDAPGVLLFAETSRDDRFDELKSGAERAAPLGPWQLSATDEAMSFLARRQEDGATLALVAGRQIVTAESLEVLALCTTARFEDGQSIDATIDAVHESDALPVLPFGVGKWRGQRGRLARAMLHDDAKHNGRPVFAGDNRNRLSWLPRHALLNDAMQRGEWVLPGSDPLPMPDQVAHAGSFGLGMEMTLDCKTPGAQVRDAIRERHAAPRYFGSASGLGAFVRLQLAMQWRKRMR